MKRFLLMFFAALVFFGTNASLFANAETTDSSLEMQKIENLDANKDINIEIIKDNKQQRVVQVVDKQTGKVYKSIFNKKDNSFQTVEVDLKSKVENNVLNSKTLELQSSTMQLQSAQMVSSSFSLIDSGSNLSGKFKYYAYTQKIWVVQSEGESKNPIETSNNSSDLQSFRNSVNNLRGSEIRFQAAWVTGVSSTMVAVITSPTGWGPIVATLTAAGATAAAIAEAYNSYMLAKDCRFYFGRITLR
ncbi:geobacillin-26 family protein [Geobacillus thermocatenulatus]|uniref:geobacillin-26 family protein n=1 Tax=Geobacillus thermocatenulatus TaxID=33938 RepID=UPI00047306FB|nr:geobacillin-26 family protein [Geobacillus thermocatenulatus]